MPIKLDPKEERDQNITLHGFYEVQGVANGDTFIQIKDDSGRLTWYRESKFVKV